ncbi:MAG: hypothetical protein ACO3GX_17340 [Gemmataceae bacterium]|jgi:hypothetical protein
MRNFRIAEALGVSVKRLRHLGFSLKRIVVRKVCLQANACEIRIFKKERQV